MGSALRSFRDIVRWETSTWNELNSVLKDKHGLPLGRYEVLQFVASHAAVSVDQIAREIGIPTATASTLVLRLEASGYCTNRAPTGAPDVPSIRISDSGATLVSEVERTLQSHLQAIWERFGLGPAATGFANQLRKHPGTKGPVGA